MKSTAQTDLGLLVLRVGAGVMMMTHGWGKLLMLLDGKGHDFADPVGAGPMASLLLAVFAEFLCALLVVLGVKTRWTAIPLVVTMAVAALVVHASDPFNVKELAALYGVVFLALVLTGGGRYSFDGWLGGRRR